MFKFFRKKKKATKQVSESEHVDEQGFESPVWYKVGEGNPFDAEILDVRSVTLNIVATTTEQWIAENFSTSRADNGSGFVEKEIDNSSSFEISISYPHNGELLEGVVVKSQSMDEKWDIYANTAILSEGELELSMTGSYLRQEDITVPAGEFSGCVKFKVLSEYTYKTGVGPLSVTATGTAEVFHWLAPDVGTVKRQTVISSNGIIVSTKIDELTYYDVPR